MRKKKVNTLSKRGQVVVTTMGTIFAVGMGTAAMFSAYELTYELAEKLVGNKGCEEEEDD